MAASSDLPSDYDAIVLGTGMTECIVAAALSRNGYNVLHIDRNDYYSGDWACFHFKTLEEWINSKQDPSLAILDIKDNTEAKLKETEKHIPLKVNSATVRNVCYKIYVSEEVAKVETPAVNTEENKGTVDDDNSSNLPSSTECANANAQEIANCESDSLAREHDESTKLSTESSQESTENSAKNLVMTTEKECVAEEVGEQPLLKENESEALKKWTFTGIKNLWRKFNIDIMPKVLYCRGPMVELLISSDVAKYCEFKTVSRVLTVIKGKLEQVPCSRSDVFASKQVSMIEKRMMMKFLTFCMEYKSHPNEYEGYEDKPFHEYLKFKKLSDNVKHYIQHSIAMVTDQASTLQGLEACQRFIQSLGRYGNTAFLWPVYGSGELPQCFCRMCAVFGGVYCLRKAAQCMITDADNKCQAIIDSDGQRLNTKWLIMEASYASEALLSTPVVRYTSRAILLTDRSIKSDGQDNITLLSFPIEGRQSPVTLFELPSSSYSCPPDMYLVHLMCLCENGAEQDLKEVIEALFQVVEKESDASDSTDSRPHVLWSLKFEIADTSSCITADTTPDNVFVVGGPNHVLDFDYSIQKAKEIFDVIAPGEEFLPKAPNPEDIIWDDGEGNKTKESGFEPGSEAKNQGNGTEEDTGKDGVKSTTVVKEENRNINTETFDKGTDVVSSSNMEETGTSDKTNVVNSSSVEEAGASDKTDVVNSSNVEETRASDKTVVVNASNVEKGETSDKDSDVVSSSNVDESGASDKDTDVTELKRKDETVKTDSPNT